VCQVFLKDCSYVKESSLPGSVECIRINPERKTLIIMDKKKESAELINYMRDYLTSK